MNSFERMLLVENSKTPKFIGFFIIVCFAIGLIITISQMNNQTLTGYVDDSNNIFTTIEPYSTPDIIPDMQLYTDNTVGLAIRIPNGWTKVIKEGNQTFIEPDTASYVQIIKSAYVPGLNSMTEDVIQNDITSIGGSFVSFSQQGNTGYTVLYQIYQDNVLFNCIEITRIDLYNVVRIVINTPAEVYDQLSNYISAIADSVEWNPPNPIPADYILVYNNFGNFEFAVPMAWNKYIENEEYVAKDNVSGAEMHVSVAETNVTYENVNQGTFAEYLSAGKEGFSIKQFTANTNLIYCVSSYTANGFAVYRVDYLLSTGYYEYAICFICPADLFQSISPMFDTAFSLFRTFN